MAKQPQALKRTSIGGQALLEGVMMRGPEKSAMAVRHTSGEIRIETEEIKKPKRAKLFKAPFIRGIFNFVDSLVLGSKCLIRSAELSGFEDDAIEEKATLSKEENEKRQKRLMNVLVSISMVLGVVLAVGLFIWLPTGIYNLLKSPFPFLDDRFLQAVFEGLFKIAIFLAYVWAVTFMKDIRRVFMYHGAEHKTIACFEKGLPLTVQNVQAQTRFHPRCGTSFIFLMLLVGIVVALFIPHTLPSVLRTIIKLLCLPIIMGIGYEALRLTGRKDNLFTRIIATPGLWVQRLTTKEPEDGMVECAVEAFVKVLPDDEQAEVMQQLTAAGVTLSAVEVGTDVAAAEEE